MLEKPITKDAADGTVTTRAWEIVTVKTEK